MTNGDKIRQMTDEELVAWLREGGVCDMCVFSREFICHTDCDTGMLMWMKEDAVND